MKLKLGWRGALGVMAAVCVGDAGCVGDDDPGDGDGSGSADTAQVHKLLSSDYSGNQMSVVFAAADGSVNLGAEVSPGTWEFDARGGGALQVVQKTRQNPAAGLITNEIRVDKVFPGELIEMEGTSALPAECVCAQGESPSVPGDVDLRVITERYFNPTPRSEDNFVHVFVDDARGLPPQTPRYDSRAVMVVSCSTLGYADLRAKAVTYVCPASPAK